jgi:hypothetical protein
MVATIVGVSALFEVGHRSERDDLLGDDRAGKAGEDDDPGIGPCLNSTKVHFDTQSRLPPRFRPGVRPDIRPRPGTRPHRC